MATILIADDAAFLRVMLKDLLERAGHTVVTEAANGLEAIDKYRAYRPELVILDLNMPEMGGIEALEHIMRMDAKAKVIMCSALGHRHLIVNSVHRGAKDYILKPFNADRVLTAVDRVFHPSVLMAE
ncbi:response regulator [Paenibacillus antri]|uniref:Response regulator n=1 Tax=Paenibacillus antri TaxID=2582848 RepID=A0A5R9G085_9BACL|nr:response regulator [Paenibacillus antri]TLS49737.1 response regulator [Paenibacillus antri]